MRLRSRQAHAGASKNGSRSSCPGLRSSLEKDGKQKDIRPCIEAIDRDSVRGTGAATIALQDQDQIKPRIQDVMEQLFGIAKINLCSSG